jgi:uncharacterized metal-binding protein
MAVFFLIGFTTAVVGGIIGWFSRGRIVLAITICFLLSLAILATLMISNAASDGLTWQNWVTDLIFYQSIPFALFIGVPCVASGALTSAWVYSKKRHDKMAQQ